MGRRRKHIKKSAYFPNISKKNHSVESDQDGLYNCIAFAAGETHRKWWPVIHPDAHWPSGAPLTETVEAFLRAFETLGYQQCANGAYEEGKEKIVFYAFAGRVKHAARQVARGKWASKLDDAEDIIHELNAVAAGGYGDTVAFMSRPKVD